MWTSHCEAFQVWPVWNSFWSDLQLEASCRNPPKSKGRIVLLFQVCTKTNDKRKSFDAWSETSGKREESWIEETQMCCCCCCWKSTFMPIGADYSDWCWLMPIDADLCKLMVIDSDWWWLVLIDGDWCWLVLIDADLCQLMLIDLIDADLWWLILIDAD